jgi:hypothetical protein
VTTDYAPLIQRALDIVAAQVGCSDLEAMPILLSYAREYGGGSFVDLAQEVVDGSVRFGD